ncbi:ExbD/TolR family protein [Veronia pacifica]|uniref:Biopolymer transporter ExbD n=1 Tax=Veronia pacifica TaxID=1080227 RepID=A0A1C3EKH9_9GAMM|nr:biopolymer transporter ExbD [Veronia pacifica]ODA33742.1 biopolymer transporter ExbD [Veronia pacifica]
MISHASDSQKESFGVDLTPLLDILFIVMVFLLLTASVQIKTMEVTIPSTNEKSVLSVTDSDVVTINILAEEPHWAIEGKAFSQWALFAGQIQETVARYPDRKVIIAPDKDASVERMLKLLAFLQTNNIDATNIVMEEDKT